MDETTLAMVWDGMTPQERRCMAMMIDAMRGPWECMVELNAAYSREFQMTVLAKRDYLLNIDRGIPH